MNVPEDLTILRIKDLEGYIGLSRSKIYEMLNPRSKRHDPGFPRQVRLGIAAVGWYRGEVLSWLANRRKS